jgi:hypothetical protein
MNTVSSMKRNLIKHITKVNSSKASMILVICFFTNYNHCVFGQTDNYWSWNFNTPSTLMAGSVVGGDAGASAIYYNPSLINHEDNLELSLSASIFSIQSFTADNIDGHNINVEKNNATIQPKFISFSIPGKNERLGLEFALLSPTSEDLEYSINHISQLDVIKRTEGASILFNGN